MDSHEFNPLLCVVDKPDLLLWGKHMKWTCMKASAQENTWTSRKFISKGMKSVSKQAIFQICKAYIFI
jgi:hypothetical protein